MISAEIPGTFRAAIQTVFATAAVSAPRARAVGEGCTPAAHTFCVTNTSDTTDPDRCARAITTRMPPAA
jgi:hypothetical protein